MTNLGIWCFRCGSGDPDKLYGRVGAPWGVLCARCWHQVGCPWPRHIATPAEALSAENKTRERIRAAGPIGTWSGTDEREHEREGDG